MLKRASIKNMIQRVSTRPVRHLVTVQVESVLMPAAAPGIDEGSELSVCFERGGKMASSHDRYPAFSPGGSGSVTSFHGQELRLVVTLYKHNDKKNIATPTFQKKTGTLVVRRKLPVAGADSGVDRQAAVQYRGVGVVELDLSAVAATVGTGSEGGDRREVLLQCDCEGAEVVFRVIASMVDSQKDSDSACAEEDDKEDAFGVHS
mmetsp:Transcript_20087/g.33835  ORF Transcript_20087/g.33835 Transcript_20087/m.33835 type:complete len:205 (+) Transcript_20087:111-725(+)